MTSKKYIPERGDIVWLNINPQTGHEQSGRRPALVISPRIYNEKTGLAIFCPVTNQQKGYPFEVKIPDSIEIKGVILSDQIKGLDWISRQAEFVCNLPKSELSETFKKINALINFSL